jgi:hypothetical protein
VAVVLCWACEACRHRRTGTLSHKSGNRHLEHLCSSRHSVRKAGLSDGTGGRHRRTAIRRPGLRASGAILNLGPTHADAVAWLASHRGVTDRLPQVSLHCGAAWPGTAPLWPASTSRSKGISPWLRRGSSCRSTSADRQRRHAPEQYRAGPVGEHDEPGLPLVAAPADGYRVSRRATRPVPRRRWR